MKHQRSRGVALIEAALVMLALSSLLVGSLYYGRLAMSGAALDRAASNAARYLSTVAIENLHDSARRAVVLAAAQAMVDETFAAAGVAVQDLQVEFLCDPGACASLPPGSTPAKVGVLLTIQYQDSLFATNVPTQLSAYAEVGRDN